MKIYLAADHAGFEIKNAIQKTLLNSGYEMIDEGALSLDLADDYPDFMKKAVEMLSTEKNARAILFGGSGQGEAMVANRYKGVRAAVYYGGPTDIIKLSREHNDANVLSIGARFVTLQEAESAIILWLNTPFSGDERHKRRISKIDEL